MAWMRPFFILRIVRPRIFESTFRNRCAKELDGALRKPTSFVLRICSTQTPNREILSLKFGRTPKETSYIFAGRGGPDEEENNIHKCLCSISY